jgi:hypothetical protein
LIRPLVVDARAVSHLVSTGVLADRVAALAARMETLPPGDPSHYAQDAEGWLSRKGYANGQVRTFALSVFAGEVVGAEPSDRILRVCRAILDPRTEIVTDARRMDEVHDRVAEGVATAGAVGALWRDADRFWGYDEAPEDGAPIANPNGQRGAERHCPVPAEVLRACFDGVPLVWCLALEGGNRKYNLRWCRPSGAREIDMNATPSDTLAAMRIVAAHSHLLPRRAA